MKERHTKKPTRLISSDEFDRKFDDGQDISEYVDWSRAKAVNPDYEVMQNIDCSCQHTRLVRKANAVEEFKTLRESCAALKLALVPDLSGWENARVSLQSDGSGHHSILLGAFERSCLHRLTLPIHKYLLVGGSLRPELQNQYLRDLQERWFIRPDPLKRHKHSKGYLGRLSELLVAQWMESELGLRVVGLEATGSKHDILVRSSDNEEAAIEAKFIGTEDSDFERLQEMQIFGSSLDLETASDFLLTRIYEAGKQLSAYPHRKKAIIVIDDFFTNALTAVLKFGHIDWQNPKLRSRNDKWLEYLRRQKYYPAIESELAPTLATLDEIRVFRLMADETLQEAFALAR